MLQPDRARAWRPAVPGVHEVLHASFAHHAYPAHTHSEWTLLIVDSGTVSYELGGQQRQAGASGVTLLPPHVAHDGRSADATGFRKRVVYLDEGWLSGGAIGRSVDRPLIDDPAVVAAVRRLHGALAQPGEELAAETRLLAIHDRLAAHLGDREVPRPAGAALARSLRELLDQRITAGITLAEAGRLLGAHPSSLGRAFHDAFRIAPHAYLVSRRVDRARHLLRDGWPVAAAAIASGFYDQAHLTRHFRRVLAMTPAEYRRGHAT